MICGRWKYCCSVKNFVASTDSRLGQHSEILPSFPIYQTPATMHKSLSDDVEVACEAEGQFTITCKPLLRDFDSNRIFYWEVIELINLVVSQVALSLSIPPEGASNLYIIAHQNCKAQWNSLNLVHRQMDFLPFVHQIINLPKNHW